MNSRNGVGTRLKTIRGLLDMTQGDLAQLARLSRSSVSLIESHSFGLSEAKLGYLQEKLPVNRSYLAEGTGGIFPKNKKLVLLRFSSTRGTDLVNRARALRVLSADERVTVSYRFAKHADSPLIAFAAHNNTRMYLLLDSHFPSMASAIRPAAHGREFCPFLTQSGSFRCLTEAVEGFFAVRDEDAFSAVKKAFVGFAEYLRNFKAFMEKPGQACFDPSLERLPNFNRTLRHPEARRSYLKGFRPSYKFYMALCSFIQGRTLEEVWVSPIHDRRVASLIEYARKLQITEHEFRNAYRSYAGHGTS